MLNDRRHDVAFIEVAGGIGSGKTTLVDMLADCSMKGIYEDHTINPFWKTFYTEPSFCAFETEISFLLQHYHFIKMAAARAHGAFLLDHSFELDMAYAQMELEGSRREIFHSLYREIRQEIGPPCALVFITCSGEEMLRRIRARGRPFEDNLTPEFLTDLQRALERRITTISGMVPIVRIDSETTDFHNDKLWRESIVKQLNHLIGVFVADCGR